MLESPPEQFLTLSYRYILHRAPDKPGYQHYLSELQRGASKRKILRAIYNSQEAVALRSCDLSISGTPQEIARACIQRVFGRNPTLSEIASAATIVLTRGLIYLHDHLRASPEARHLSHTSLLHSRDLRAYVTWRRCLYFLFTRHQKPPQKDAANIFSTTRLKRIGEPDVLGLTPRLDMGTIGALPRSAHHQNIALADRPSVCDGPTRQVPGSEKAVTEASVITGHTVNILLISHDASLTGAPAVLLNLASWLVEFTGANVRFLVGGQSTERLTAFRRIGPCLHVDDIATFEKSKLADFVSDCRIVYANSVASAKLLQAALLALPANVRVIAHSHERRTVLGHFKEETEYITQAADHIIAVSDEAAGELREFDPRRLATVTVIPPFIEEFDEAKAIGANFSLITKNNFNLKARIFGCGTIESRKGFDLFCETVATLSLRRTDFEAIWIGPSPDPSEPNATLSKFGLENKVQAIGQHPYPRTLYHPSDIFFMSSREDPFPLVCIEAAERELPIVCFDERAGGTASIVRKAGCGLVCEYLNTDDAAHCLNILLDDPELRRRMGSNGKAYTADNFLAKSIMPEIAAIVFGDIGRKNPRPAIKRFSVLVISFGPAPTPGVSVVEGGGLRSWGLAKSIAQVDSFSVTLGLPSWYYSAEQRESQTEMMTVDLAYWSDTAALVKLAQEFDAVIVSYCYGAYSEEIAKNRRSDQILILDCYVPIFVEVSARRAPDLIREAKDYRRDSAGWSNVLRCGDILLCANEEQRSFYFGALCGHGDLPPHRYDAAPNIIIAPFGIQPSSENLSPSRKRPISERINDNRRRKILWFGGVYPWFDIKILIKAISRVNDAIPCHLTIVGAKNPFNHHQDFIAIADEIISMSQLEEFSDLIWVADWVKYEDRIDWYKDADLLVTLNRDGLENQFAWRTRVVDFVGSNARFATNGGDPLSEKLISIGFASRISANCPEALAEDLIAALKDSGGSEIDWTAFERLKTSLQQKTIGLSITSAIEAAHQDRANFQENQRRLRARHV